MTPSGIRLVIGIPTVARGRDYVEKTVDLLLCRGGAALDDRARLVLMNAEAPADAHRAVDSIRNRQSSAIARGILTVISVTDHRPAVAAEPREAPTVIPWSTKQVLDAAALMEHCAPLGTHYIHLEDDILPAPGYLTRILEFVEAEERAGGWYALAFYCPTPTVHRRAINPERFWGLIGVLFRTSDLRDLVEELRRRKDEAPVDNIFTDYLAARRLELRAHVPSLFEHVGFQSSLPSRVQSNRAWRWAGDRTAAHRFLRLLRRSIEVRWLQWRARNQAGDAPVSDRCP